MTIRYKREMVMGLLLSSWTAKRVRLFREPPWRGHRCGGCGVVSHDSWIHPAECTRRAKRYRGGWNAHYDDARADPKRAALARKYYAIAVAEYDNPAWWSG
jgi:hypothetical protein